MTLFDPDEYTTKGATAKAPRKPRQQRNPFPSVAGVVDDTWRVVVAATPGLVHAEAAPSDFGSIAWCGLIGSRRSFEDGQLVQRCVSCGNSIRSGVLPVDHNGVVVKPKKWQARSRTMLARTPYTGTQTPSWASRRWSV